MSAYGLVTPCANCPFRSDIKPFLRASRIVEILRAEGEFVCHKTTEDNPDDETERVVVETSQVCAGWLICLEHDNRPNQLMRIAERLGMYDRTKLRMDAPVYKGAKAAIAAYRKAGAP